MIYFTSDLHLNHRKILTLGRGRPFATIEEMNASLIERWNSVVREYHEPVYVLGDFAFSYKDSPSIADQFEQLNGEKHLVRGNHDEQNAKVLKLPWKSITDLLHIRYGEHRFIACHFPLERWWHMERGVLHVHGHCHGSAPTRPHRFDVGVDVYGEPVSADRLIASATSHDFRPEDYYA